MAFKCVLKANFMEVLARDVGSNAHCTVEQNISDSDVLDIPPPPRMESFKETVQMLEDVYTDFSRELRLSRFRSYHQFAFK